MAISLEIVTNVITTAMMDTMGTVNQIVLNVDMSHVATPTMTRIIRSLIMFWIPSFCVIGFAVRLINVGSTLISVCTKCYEMNCTIDIEHCMSSDFPFLISFLSTSLVWFTLIVCLLLISTIDTVGKSETPFRQFAKLSLKLKR